MTRVLILADDLTGAQDSAAPFAAKGAAVTVTLTEAAFHGAMRDPSVQIISHATGTRELPADQAHSIVLRLAPAIAGFDGLIFKKIDSRMKGNIAAELSALPVAGKLALCSPAIPRLGRLVRGGAVVGAGVEAAIPIAPRLGLAAQIPEVQTEAELAAALPENLSSALFIGAAGLAEVLAARLFPTGRAVAPLLPGPLLLAIGSRDPITLAQVARLSMPAHFAPNGQVSDPGGDTALVQMTAGKVVLPGTLAAQSFAAGIAGVLQNHPFQSLFACGGETAHAILTALGIDRLDLLGEVLPGVPVAQVPACAAPGKGLMGKGLTVITKSGGFGGPDCLVQLLDKFAESSRKDTTTI